MSTYSVGSLVRCREREWVVLPSEDANLLRLRPLGGTDNEATGIYLPLSEALGVDHISSTEFSLPDPALAGDYVSGRLLRDAARLAFRSGAGPFRSLGHISVRPRPFQLVPLLMALRLDKVRLLISDDVGVGKTIEAGLIARELLDRGDARRLAVICPPHLCEQWQRELADKFSIQAVIVRSSTMAQLERELPPGDISVFQYYSALVVSIDFVKSDKWRPSFINGCPDLVLVDEAHTAALSSTNRATQQRHALLRSVADGHKRHLILLTATPHSGVEDAFLSLLSLVDPKLGQLNLSGLSEGERDFLASHFVQRRRADVQQWSKEGAFGETPFPIRESRDAEYYLSRSPEYLKLFDDVYQFARELVRTTDGGSAVWRSRVRAWTALALLRCVMSSPAAAEATLRARIGKLDPQAVAESADGFEYAQYVLDLSGQDLGQEQEPTEETIDFEPTSLVEEGGAQLEPNDQQRLQSFLRRASKLRGKDDPKAAKAAEEIAALLHDGYHPIVYCRYIATAKYLAEELQSRLRKQWHDLQVVAVTGDSLEEEREERIAELSLSPTRVLVATDCMSEGINLQNAFNAVLHYDLPWNPNRLEQREGRVDRYGQPSPIVRTILLYGKDNLIDQAVLKVLLRKAISIHKTLGITVPLPVDSESVMESVVRSLFQEGGAPIQLDLFAGDTPVGVDQLHKEWDRAAERERQSRTRYAQRSIPAKDVAHELAEADMVLGSPETVQRFVRTACERLQAPLTRLPKAETGADSVWRLPIANLPQPIRERIHDTFSTRRSAGMPSELLITFGDSHPEGTYPIGRTHPLTEALAEYLLDTALDPRTDTRHASRCGVFRTSSVDRRTTLLLLRLRLRIETVGRTVPVLAEELVVAGFQGSLGNMEWLPDEQSLQLLEEAHAVEPLSASQAQELLQTTLSWIPELNPDMKNIGLERAAILSKSHTKVRQITQEDKVEVQAIPPLDVLGAYILLPVPKGIARQ